MLDQGVALAELETERLRATSFAGTISSPRVPIPGWTGYERQVIVSNVINNNLKQVIVRIFWTVGAGAETSTDITTYFVNNAFIY